LTAVTERRPRDPAGRRQAIIEAAVRVIARQGLGKLTHRRVAAEAEVPVGSTTYYFRDLGALREAALAHAATTSAEYLEQWRRDLDANADLAATLARLTADYLADRDRHRTLNELYIAASHRPELQRLARLWPEGLVALLEPRIGRRAADAVTVFLDGATLHSLITGNPPSIDALCDAISRLTQDSANGSAGGAGIGGRE
jgi:DNA-binding transcriptional regulator YbjK